MKKAKNQKLKGEKHSIVSPPSAKRKTGYVWLNVLPDDLWLNVRQGTTIWEALQKTDVELESECGGLGKCGKCRVKVLSSIGPPSTEEEEFLDEEELKRGIRLACRTKVNHDLVISTGETDAEAGYFQILTTSHILKSSHLPLLCLEPLVEKRLIALPPKLQSERLSELDRIKLVMGHEYQDLKATLNCLRTLPEMLRRTQFSGAAVLHEDCLMAWQNREEMHHHCGLVFDLGTSTVVGKLISLRDGSEVAVASCLNSQSRHGTNVISRIQYVKENPRGLE
ncbi:MAG: 2Fe-2S iron-sulfur cluster binding domain-containing protein, partial [Chloroflexi bacterium]|nr:2Fe-2S iron-sulfur cluster binding domain-containing protein [Chloroflexota bacterium]